MKPILSLVVAVTLVCGCLRAAETPPAPATPTTPASGAKLWKNGPPTDPAFFPIAVWCQDPKNAAKYKAAGINLYMALWEGPTEEQLAALKKADLKVICAQNEVGLKHKDDPTIIAWMHGDEPDNAQSKPGGGYGPPIATQKIVDDYKAMAAKDATRPVMLNLGQGVAWDKYIGRGVRSNHPEDYAEYMQGCDLVSFDIYPVAGETDAAVKEKLWLPAFGVKRLMDWAQGKKHVWCCIECTGIDNVNRKPTPQEIKSEVWQALIQGASGLIYFCHEFKPKFKEAAVLDDPPSLKAVTETNALIKELAPALNSPDVKDGATVTPADPAVPVVFTLRKTKEALYLLTAASRPGTTKAKITIKGLPVAAEAEVLGESRKVAIKNGAFQDEFKEWDVHLYKVAGKPAQ